MLHSFLKTTAKATYFPRAGGKLERRTFCGTDVVLGGVVFAPKFGMLGVSSFVKILAQRTAIPVSPAYEAIRRE